MPVPVLTTVIGSRVTSSVQGHTIIAGQPSCDYGANPDCITISFQLQLPLPTDAAKDAYATIVERAHRTLSDILARECTVLRAGNQGGCRIVRLNFSANAAERQDSEDGVLNASASATYRLDEKGTPIKP